MIQFTSICFFITSSKVNLISNHFNVTHQKVKWGEMSSLRMKTVSRQTWLIISQRHDASEGRTGGWEFDIIKSGAIWCLLMTKSCDPSSTVDGLNRFSHFAVDGFVLKRGTRLIQWLRGEYGIHASLDYKHVFFFFVKHWFLTRAWTWHQLLNHGLLSIETTILVETNIKNHVSIFQNTIELPNF